MRRRSDFSSLCRGFIVPQEVRDTESVTLFLDAAEQMRRILCDAGFIRLEPLTADEIVGTADDSGLIARYFALGTEGIVTNEDLRLDDGQIRIGNRSLAMYTLSDLDYVPQAVGTDSRYERFSTDRSDCRLSFAATCGAAARTSAHLQPIRFSGQPRRDAQKPRSESPQHELSGAVLACQLRE